MAPRAKKKPSLICTREKRGDLTIETCREPLKYHTYLRVSALRQGRRLGHVEATLALDTHEMAISGSHVNPAARRHGVGTALYAAMNELACRAGGPLQSDSVRSPFAESFWRKQAARGRARCVVGEDPSWVGTPNLDPEIMRHAKGHSLPVPTADDGYGETGWPCWRWEIASPCSTPSLAGRRHR